MKKNLVFLLCVLFSAFVASCGKDNDAGRQRQVGSVKSADGKGVADDKTNGTPAAGQNGKGDDKTKGPPVDGQNGKGDDKTKGPPVDGQSDKPAVDSSVGTGDSVTSPLGTPSDGAGNSSFMARYDFKSGDILQVKKFEKNGDNVVVDIVVERAEIASVNMKVNLKVDTAYTIGTLDNAPIEVEFSHATTTPGSSERISFFLAGKDEGRYNKGFLTGGRIKISKCASSTENLSGIDLIWIVD